MSRALDDAVVKALEAAAACEGTGDLAGARGWRGDADVLEGLRARLVHSWARDAKAEENRRRGAETRRRQAERLPR
ncbi:MAG: hypothetical protein M3O91_09705 [Chloroflexota bacterium]|nr:hypothetical protein [Chloroflexota bacterium]